MQLLSVLFVGRIRNECAPLCLCAWDKKLQSHSSSLQQGKRQNNTVLGTSLPPVIAFQYRPPGKLVCYRPISGKEKSVPHESQHPLVFLVCWQDESWLGLGNITENVISNSLAQLLQTVELHPVGAEIVICQGDEGGEYGDNQQVSKHRSQITKVDLICLTVVPQITMQKNQQREQTRSGGHLQATAFFSQNFSFRLFSFRCMI